VVGNGNRRRKKEIKGEEKRRKWIQVDKEKEKTAEKRAGRSIKVRRHKRIII
jgi:hypothetical protein